MVVAQQSRAQFCDQGFVGSYPADSKFFLSPLYSLSPCIRSFHKNKLGFVSVGCNILSTSMYCLNLSPEVALNLFDEHHLASVPRFKSFWDDHPL